MGCRFFQDLVQDSYMMEVPEVVSWFRCQEYIRRTKHILLIIYFEQEKRRTVVGLNATGVL